MMEIIIILLRFALIFALALIFGLERQRSHQPVGFGTFVFVSVGACGLTMAALILNPEDPLPVIGAIITGIGFLGAGALIKTTDKIFGFTSAAGIWLFAILGVVTGLGEYLLALSMYILIWATLFIDKFLQKQGIGSYQKKLSVVTRAENTKCTQTQRYTLNYLVGHGQMVNLLQTSSKKLMHL